MKRPLLLSLFALATAFVPKAAADPLDTGGGAEAFSACVAAGALDQCRGVLARACVAANGDATMSLVLCWNEEAEAWDGVIADRLQRLATPERREALTRAQEAWTQWRDAECAYRSDPSAGGSGVQVVMVECSAELGAARAAMLSAEITP
jgi:uncharacterized protein YecT (DUF1311 family)